HLDESRRTPGAFFCPPRAPCGPPPRASSCKHFAHLMTPTQGGLSDLRSHPVPDSFNTFVISKRWVTRAVVSGFSAIQNNSDLPQGLKLTFDGTIDRKVVQAS